MMNEQCWVLVGGMRDDLWWGKRVKPTEGAPASVAFNPDYVTQRDDKYHDVVGFIHTHPSFTANYSSRDDRTMKAWVLSLGKPLVCCIIGIDGLRAWWYLNDEDPPVEYQAKSLRGLVFGLTPEEFFEKEETEFEETEFLKEIERSVESRPDAAESGVEPTSEDA
jgi:proteasome lid subunit RPN8/RPN11